MLFISTIIDRRNGAISDCVTRQSTPRSGVTVARAGVDEILTVNLLDTHDRMVTGRWVGGVAEVGPLVFGIRRTSDARRRSTKTGAKKLRPSSFEGTNDTAHTRTTEADLDQSERRNDPTDTPRRSPARTSGRVRRQGQRFSKPFRGALSSMRHVRHLFR